MFAVVEIAGKQFKVTPKDHVEVPSLQEKPGTKIHLDRVLLLSDDKTVVVGHPLVTGASVEATVMDGVRGEKVIVFKKKKRKGYRLKKGHRQDYTRVQITNIVQ